MFTMRSPGIKDSSTIYNAEWSTAHVPRMSQRFYLLTSAHQHMLVFDAPLNRHASIREDLGARERSKVIKQWGAL
jgi:hypothetical protein